MSLLYLLPLLLLSPAHAAKQFNMCCAISAFRVEPCMISDGRVLENFSSKEKIAEFPIMNGLSTHPKFESTQIVQLSVQCTFDYNYVT